MQYLGADGLWVRSSCVGLRCQAGSGPGSAEGYASVSWPSKVIIFTGVILNPLFTSDVQKILASLCRNSIVLENFGNAKTANVDTACPLPTALHGRHHMC